MAGFAASQSLAEAAKSVARNGTESKPNTAFSLACADISRSPIGACPVCTARLMSLPLNSEPLPWTTISTAPPVRSRDVRRKRLAFSVWKFESG